MSSPSTVHTPQIHECPPCLPPPGIDIIVPQLAHTLPSATWPTTLAKINFSYSILFHLTTSYSSYFGGKKGISRNKTSFFLLMHSAPERPTPSFACPFVLGQCSHGPVFACPHSAPSCLHIGHPVPPFVCTHICTSTVPSVSLHVHVLSHRLLTDLIFFVYYI